MISGATVSRGLGVWWLWGCRTLASQRSEINGTLSDRVLLHFANTGEFGAWLETPAGATAAVERSFDFIYDS